MPEAYLRLADVCALYDAHAERQPLKQLDLLDDWFKEAVIVHEESSEKKDAFFDRDELRIHACMYHGRLFMGYDETVIQLCARLLGRASGSPEKERKNAALMRRKLAAEWTEVPENILPLQENVHVHLQKMADTEKEKFRKELQAFIRDCAETRSSMSVQQKEDEPAPMDDEVSDGILYNAAGQCLRACDEGTENAWLWLLMGCLLRNEAGRILRYFDSSFVPVYRDRSETPQLCDRIDALEHPQHYYYVYAGDDLDRRFPGIWFYCDCCEAVLNEQENFDDHLEYWQCRSCGFVNEINERVIYNTREDRMLGKPADPVKIKAAIERRRLRVYGNILGIKKEQSGFYNEAVWKKRRRHIRFRR